MPKPIAAETRRARIERVRVAVPASEGRVCLTLGDGERVHGWVANADGTPASLAGLLALERRRVEALLGLYRLDDGSRWLHWALDDAGEGLVPPSQAAIRRDALRGLSRWLPVLLMALAGGAAAALRMMDGFGWALLLVLCAVVLIVAAVAVFSHAANGRAALRDRRVSAMSERALAQALRERVGAEPAGRGKRGRKAARVDASARTNAGVAADADRNDAAPATPLSPALARDPAPPAHPGHPPLRRWQGRLADLQMQQRTSGGGDARRNFGVYRFRLGAQTFQLQASREAGANAPFLAEGDRVELIAHDDPARTDGEALVYALHSLEDGRRYVAHAVFLSDFAALAMTRMTWPSARDAARLALAVCVFATALIGGIGWWAGGDEDWPALLAVAAFMTLAIPGTLLACFALSRWRWRLRGRPSGRRQATAQRVYEAMALGPPWAWRLPDGVFEL